MRFRRIAGVDGCAEAIRARSGFVFGVPDLQLFGGRWHQRRTGVAVTLDLILQGTDTDEWGNERRRTLPARCARHLQPPAASTIR